MEIETADTSNQSLYKQVFSINMRKTAKPTIADFDPDSYGYTKVSFEPDFKRFGLEKIDDDMMGLLFKRVYDIAGVTSSKVNVHLNGKKIKGLT